MAYQLSREQAVRKYFAEVPKKPTYRIAYVQFALGGLLLLLALCMFLATTGYFFRAEFSVAVCGSFLILALVPGFFLFTGTVTFLRQRSKYRKKLEEAEPKPSDEQMDAWLQGDLRRVREEAQQKLDLLPDQIISKRQEPIQVVGPSTGTLVTRGKDGIVRFSRNDVVVVFLSNYHLAAYSCTLEMSDGLQTQESTQEYHYTDVVSVATQADSSIFKVVVSGEDKPLANYQKFSLSVASGEKIEVAIAFPQLEDYIKNAKFAPTGAEEAVKAIRTMLREKKGGAQG